MTLKGYSSIVTGSTSGIGLAIAHELAKNGSDVVINGRKDLNDDILYELNGLRSYGVKAEYIAADLSNPDSASRFIKEAEETLGKIDILVNNAGIQYVAHVENFPIDKWDNIIATDLSAVFFTVKATLPGMQGRNFGRIVNIASTHGQVASPGKVAYIAAKHGVVGLTKVVALENAERNITCNAICPGWVDTPLVRKQIQERAKENGTTEEEEAKKLVGEKQPNKMFTPPEAIAQGVLYFANPENKYATGTTLDIDGGWTAW